MFTPKITIKKGMTDYARRLRDSTDFADEAAQAWIAEVRRRTPSATGELRSGWAVSIKKNESKLTVSLLNKSPRAEAKMSFLASGTRPHLILPTHGKALRWFNASETVFARSVVHPGFKANLPFRNSLNFRANPVFMRLVTKGVVKKVFEV